MFFGGAEYPKPITILARVGAERILLSYAYPPSRESWGLIRAHGFEVMADSGAFTAWKQGRALDIDDYIRWLREHEIPLYFNLDVVGDQAATRMNQEYMEAQGMTPIPVFHIGEPWALLREMVSGYPVVGLGGTVGQPTRVKEHWLRQVFTLCPSGQLHALGVAHERLLRQFPLWGADSTWWLYKFQGDKQRRMAPGGDQTAEREARARHLMELQTAPKKGFPGTLPLGGG